MAEGVHSYTQFLLSQNGAVQTDATLRQLVNQYPYYAPARFLLLQKLKSLGSADYAAEYGRAVLYYHNPLLFESINNPQRFHTEIIFEERDTKPAQGVTDESKTNDTGLTYVDAPSDAEETITTAETAESNAAGEINLEAVNEVEPAVEETSTSALQAETLSTDAGTKEPEPLAFEPYHTVDYFASQGIKLSAEEKTEGQLGRQLKSFTEWLKTMKRLPLPPADAQRESAVQHLANDSVQNEEVYTEAMAEVWLKQGNKEKARAVYEKLSLLNPAKRSYFAAKIDQINHF